MTERRWLFLTAGTLALCYLSVLPTTLTVCDAGEFAALAVRGGIAHPPGYPLLTMLFRAVAALALPFPLVPQLAACSALFVVAGAGFLFSGLSVVVPASAPRCAAVLIAGTAEPVWRAASDLEPFGLNLLLAGLVVFFSSRVIAASVPSPTAQTCARPWHVGALGAAFGLGLCNHHSLVVLAPIGGVALVLHARRHGVVRGAAAALGGFAAGCAPLMYLVVTSKDGPLVWGSWQPLLDSMVTHVLRRRYGTFSLVPGADGAWWSGPWLWLSSLPQHLSFLWAAAIVLTAAAREDEPRAARRLLLGAWAGCLLMVIGFFSLFRVPLPLPGDWLVIVGRFFALPGLMLAVPLALAIDVAQRRLRAHGGLIAAALAAHLAAQAPSAARWNERVYAAFLDDITMIAGDRALVITNDDAGAFGLLYQRFVHGIPVVTLDAGPWHASWYRARAARTLGDPMVTQLRDRPLHVVVAALLRAGRAVYLEGPITDVGAALDRSYPLGPLIRLLPPGADVPDARAVYAENVALAGRLRAPARAAQQRPLSPWETSRLIGYQANWLVIERSLHDVGAELEAADAARRAAELGALIALSGD